MEELFKMQIVKNNEEFALLNIGFGVPAQNNEIIKYVANNLPEINGKGLLINGPASLPVAMLIAHAYAHTCKYIACFDPKINQYVVAISHTPEMEVGTLIPAEIE